MFASFHSEGTIPSSSLCGYSLSICDEICSRSALHLIVLLQLYIYSLSIFYISNNISFAI